jgi:hypothetical protein
MRTGIFSEFAVMVMVFMLENGIGFLDHKVN